MFFGNTFFEMQVYCGVFYPWDILSLDWLFCILMDIDGNCTLFTGQADQPMEYGGKASRIVKELSLDEEDLYGNLESECLEWESYIRGVLPWSMFILQF